MDCAEYLTVDNYHYINEKYYCQRHYNTLKPKSPMQMRISGRFSPLILEKTATEIRETEDIHGTDEDQSHSIENKEDDNQSSDLVDQIKHRNQSKDSEDKTDDPSKSNVITKDEIFEQTDSNSQEEDVNDEFQQTNNKSADNSPSLSPHFEDSRPSIPNNIQQENPFEKDVKEELKMNKLELSTDTPSSSTTTTPTASPTASPTLSSSHSDNLERFTIQLNRSSSSNLNISKDTIIPDPDDEQLLLPPSSVPSTFSSTFSSIPISPPSQPSHSLQPPLTSSPHRSLIMENVDHLDPFLSTEKAIVGTTKENKPSLLVPTPLPSTISTECKDDKSLVSESSDKCLSSAVEVDNNLKQRIATKELSEIIQDDLNMPNSHPGNEKDQSASLTDPSSKTESSNAEGLFFFYFPSYKK